MSVYSYISTCSNLLSGVCDSSCKSPPNVHLIAQCHYAHRASAAQASSKDSAKSEQAGHVLNHHCLGSRHGHLAEATPGQQVGIWCTHVILISPPGRYYNPPVPTTVGLHNFPHAKTNSACAACKTHTSHRLSLLRKASCSLRISFLLSSASVSWLRVTAAEVARPHNSTHICTF